MIQQAKPHRLGQAVSLTSQQATHAAADLLPFINNMMPSKFQQLAGDLTEPRNC